MYESEIKGIEYDINPNKWLYNSDCGTEYLLNTSTYQFNWKIVKIKQQFLHLTYNATCNESSH